MSMMMRDESQSDMYYEITRLKELIAEKDDKIRMLEEKLHKLKSFLEEIRDQEILE